MHQIVSFYFNLQRSLQTRPRLTNSWRVLQMPLIRGVLVMAFLAIPLPIIPDNLYSSTSVGKKEHNVDRVNVNYCSWWMHEHAHTTSLPCTKFTNLALSNFFFFYNNQEKCKHYLPGIVNHDILFTYSLLKNENTIWSKLHISLPDISEVSFCVNFDGINWEAWTCLLHATQFVIIIQAKCPLRLSQYGGVL